MIQNLADILYIGVTHHAGYEMAHSQRQVSSAAQPSLVFRRYAWHVRRAVPPSAQGAIVTAQALSMADKVATAARMHAAEARIAELEKQLQDLSMRVHQDALTGALNRRGLDDRLPRELARAQRRQTPLSLVMIDLDDFKRINDTHGHPVGDEVLVHLVDTVQRTLRPTDMIGRFGGEEFLLVLPDTPLQPATQTVIRLQASLAARQLQIHQQPISCTFSAGVAQFAGGQTIDDVIAYADKALYRAKKEGKNRVLTAS